MNNRDMKLKNWRRVLLCLTMALSMILSACSSEEPQPFKSSKTTDTDITSEPAVTEAEPEGAKLSMSEIEKLAKENAYRVHWYTSTEGDFLAGTSFIMDSEKFGGKILVTAFHYLIPDGQESTFKGKDLPNFVQGGTVLHMKSGESTGASLKNCIVTEDAQAVPAIDKDVAAFTLYNAEKLNSLPLSTHSLKMGDKLYLLANLWKGENINENCVYEGIAVLDMKGQLTFKFDKNYETMGASGGPIINEYGEVVAIHMASTQDNSYMYGHSAASFLAQINAGTVSSTTYEEKPEIPTASDDEDVEEYYHKAGDYSAETYFFNLDITGAEMVDSIGEVKAPEGQKFAVISMTIDTVGLNTGDFEIYSEDFWMLWDDDYSVGYDETEIDGIAGETTLIKDNSINYVKYAFLIPEKPESLLLNYMDYYYDSNDVFHEVAEHYFEIPLEGF